MDKMQELIDFLNENTKLYEAGTPKITDAQWDDAYFELKRLESLTGITLPESPTQSLKYNAVTGLEKVTHNHPMLSLDKTKLWSEFIDYFEGQPAVLMLKLDGLTCSLTYRNGYLVSAETRGNGETGENILHNAYVVNSIPKLIDYKDELIVDGEIVCLAKDFEPFAGEYKNPRNFASGSIRLLDSKECEKRNLTFVAWNVVSGLEGNSFIQKLEGLKEFGFDIVLHLDHIGDTAEADFMKDKAKELGYPIDGLVGRFDDIEYGESLGQTAHHAAAAFAFKFYDDIYASTLEDIEWSIGKSGQLTPVAIFRPITIDGTEVSRANLFNVSTMTELLGEQPFYGEIVTVFKANSIIPQIGSAAKENLAGAKTFPIPTVCPACGGTTEIVESDGGVLTLVCANPECSGQLINVVDHFAGKKGLDIRGLSKATLEKLIDYGWLEKLSDIFTLSEHRDQWVRKPGFGIKSVDRILEGIEDAKSTTLEAFISGLGIPLIGRTAAKELCKHINSYEELREKVDNDFNFAEYPTFAYAKSEYLKNFNYTEADKIYPLLRFAETEVDSVDKVCSGMTICITGKLKVFKKRDDLKAWIEARGGKVTDSVTSKTTYLINNNPDSTTAKNTAAINLEIPIVTEEEFLNEFEGN
jgi:DNA ligase (NAD+)